jgi:hypothetical protein
MRLSELSVLDRIAFDLFLDLLGEALSRKTDPRASVEAISTDGALCITLEPTGDKRPATVHTAWGTFRGDDHFVYIRSVLDVCIAASEDIRGGPIKVSSLEVVGTSSGGTSVS